MSHRVLIADDAPFVREILSHIVMSAGFEVVGHACDGLEAIEMARKLNPDIILMDVVMPKMNGVEATVSILETHPHIKVVACSTEPGEMFVSQAIGAGCIDYVVKPFEQDVFVSNLKRIAELAPGKRKSS